MLKRTTRTHSSAALYNICFCNTVPKWAHSAEILHAGFNARLWVVNSN